MKRTTPQKQYVLVDRKTVAHAVKNQCIASYTILFLSFIVSARKLELTMTTEDVCDILQIDFATFEKYRSLLHLPCSDYGGIRLYALKDMITLAEYATREKRHRWLCKIPTLQKKDE